MGSETAAPRSSWEVAPVFLVAKVSKAMRYYRDHLGFEITGTFADPPELAFVSRNGVHVMLSQARGGRPGTNRAYKDETWDAYFWVDDVGALFHEIRSKGAEIVRDPVVTFYNNKEFEVADPEGHVLCFGERLYDEGDPAR